MFTLLLQSAPKDSHAVVGEGEKDKMITAEVIKMHVNLKNAVETELKIE